MSRFNLGNPLNKKYKRALDVLDENFATFLTHVLAIGRPHWTEEIPTAAVGMPRGKIDSDKIEEFEFIFSPTFMEKLNEEGAAFILGHETMHILLNHLVLGRSFVNMELVQRLETERQKRLLTDKEQDQMDAQMNNMKKFNIAADCVINDYLASCGLLPAELGEGMPTDTKEGLMRGENIVGYNAAKCTVTEVYEDITDEQMQKMSGDGRGEGAIDDHGWIFRGTQEDMEKMEKIWEQVKGQAPGDLEDKREEEAQAQGKQPPTNKMGRWWGTEQGNLQKFISQTGASLNWAHLLKVINPDIFKVKGIAPPPLASYHKRPRKLGDRAFKKVALPVWNKDPRHKDWDKEIPSIVMALDTSGSIPERDRSRFITLAQSIPQERIHLFVCTFTTQVMPLDLDNPQFHSGGTAFSPIEDWIQSDVIPELGHYPKSVVVITDGCAIFDRSYPEEQYHDRWLWLKAASWYEYDRKPGRILPLTDFTNS